MSFPFNSSPSAQERASISVWLRRCLIVLTILGVVVLGSIVLWWLAQIAEPIVFMLFSIVLAYLLYPLVRLLQRVMPRFLAILIAYFGVFIALVVFSAYVIVTAARQLTSLVVTIQANGPEILKQVQPLENVLNTLGISPNQLQSSLQQLVNQLLILVGTLPSLLGTLFSLIINAVIVTSLSIYFLLDGPRVLTWMRTKTPVRQQGAISFFLTTVDHMMGGFLRGQLTLAVLISVIIGVGLFVLGVPYALLLALLVFVLEFVPQIGAYISGAIAILFVLITRGWQIALIYLIFSTLVQGILDGQILAPRILGRAVGLHPIVSIFALLVGAKLFGLLGAVFSAPLAGILQVLVVAFWSTWRRRHSEQFVEEPGKTQPAEEVPAPQAHGEAEVT